MDICKLSLLLPLLSAVMVTQVSADFWDAVGTIGTALIWSGKREAEPQDSLEESVLVELARNLAKECKDAINEDLAMDTLLNKFRQLDENGDVTLTGEELKKFQEFTAAKFCEKLEKEQQLKP